MNNTPVIEATELRKTFDGSEALRGLNLQVATGSISAVLGRNGAGKTTFIKILLDLVRPDAGSASVFGLATNARGGGLEIRRRTAFVSEEKTLPGSMTVDEVIHFTRSFYPRWQADAERHFRECFALPAGRPVRQLSKGMRTQLALLLGLCRGVELLVLDEPTSGLDPAAAEIVLKEIVRHVANQGTTVLFASHQIAEVDQIADHVAIIERGQVVEGGEIESLRENYARVQLVFADTAPAASFRAAGVRSVKREGRVISLVCSQGARAVLEEARGMGAISVDSQPMTLREIFLEKVNGHE